VLQHATIILSRVTDEDEEFWLEKRRSTRLANGDVPNENVGGDNDVSDVIATIRTASLFPSYIAE